MPGNIIEARGLARTYRKGPRALAGVDLSVPAACRFALLGANGAGKSTLVRILCTLSRADSGGASIAGLPLSGGSKAIRSLIGVALQDTQLDPAGRTRDQLVFQGRLYGLDRKRALGRAEELVGRFGLEPVADRKARELSGGNKRRLHVALALVHRPRVLFLDEPTVGMDPESRAAFWAEMRRLNAEEGVCVFFTTQYLEEADRHGDELAVLDAGLVAYRGTVPAFAAEHSGPGGDLEAGYLNFVESRRLAAGATKEAVHA
ncbi:MAG: ABC transporter ATP-binding protein [Spirochaetes bacterium]|nr:ABC transporter ATP-binding protein [Spirochaetota bacterium]MBU1081569.1 ABC transporter ATP-binding protein [Spirochaetota bacterium]